MDNTILERAKIVIKIIKANNYYVSAGEVEEVLSIIGNVTNKIYMQDKLLTEGRELVKSAEWASSNPNWNGVCPICREESMVGHKENCELITWLKKVKDV